jgi:hypothetical protein
VNKSREGGIEDIRLNYGKRDRWKREGVLCWTCKVVMLDVDVWPNFRVRWKKRKQLK